MLDPRRRAEAESGIAAAASNVSAAAEDQAATAAQSRAAEFRAAQSAALAARYELDAARTALKYAASGGTGRPIAVFSPETGQVLKIAHKSEGTVAAGQPLIEIGNPRTLEVEVDVLSADAVRIHRGNARHI